MVSTESELKQDVREMTGFTSERILSADGLDTSYRRAKLHIRVEKSLGADYEWFLSDEPEREQALFWWTCLFTKLQTGELDSQDIQVGAINPETLLAKDNNSITQWYRSAMNAMDAIEPSTIMRSASPVRADREYAADTFSEQSGGTGTEVDNLDL